ncbi:L,D-transpeptidase family protein [Vibrio salinus]|uniref:L,D-transpeptidase family protein n=1 Tax=Vibrio salinus TaxID=2899784 RepID=UPI001E30B29D|nr:L,D-transpeptidase family protein [Vibrio salinus]MCE0495243.1 L,D-transpeptidase family protein [Vibrio salinus]
MTVSKLKTTRLLLLTGLSAFFLHSFPAFAEVDLVKVDKSKRRMYLIENNKVTHEYRIALGKQPRGHKEQEGDQKTPEGLYILDYIVKHSSFYKAMHISYPNKQDRARAKEKGVSAGGAISVHGFMNGDKRDPRFVQSFDWTNGCIAISNRDMDEFLSLVKTGTPILIEW